MRSPRDPRRLAIANRIDTPRYSCALHVSSDAGATWTQTPVRAPQGEAECYAPDVAFDADGTLYMSFVTLRGRGHVPNAAWIVTSTDGGRTLSKPRRVLGRLVFQVRLAADPERAAARVPHVAAGLGGRHLSLLAARRADPHDALRRRRQHVEHAGPASSPQRARVLAPTPAVGPDGALYVLYLDLGEDRLDYEGAHDGRGGPPYPGPWQLVLARSRDRGATWQRVRRRAAARPDRARHRVHPAVSVAGGRSRQRAPVRGLPRRPPRRRGRLAVDARARRAALARPRRVNDTARRDGTSQYLPKLAVAPGGRLDVLYYDRRRDRARNEANEVSLQSSTDGGESFTSRARAVRRARSTRRSASASSATCPTSAAASACCPTTRARWPSGPTRARARACRSSRTSRAASSRSRARTGSAPRPPRRCAPAAASLLLAGLAVLALVVLRRGPFGPPRPRGELKQRLTRPRRAARGAASRPQRLPWRMARERLDAEGAARRPPPRDLRLRSRRSAAARAAPAHLADADAADERGEPEAQHQDAQRPRRGVARARRREAAARHEGRLLAVPSPLHAEPALLSDGARGRRPDGASPAPGSCARRRPAR